MCFGSIRPGDRKAGHHQTAPPPAPNPPHGPTETTPTGFTPAPPSPNPGTLADDIIRSEAERQVGLPLPVLRLDNAAFVFSEADPEIAAGVQSWLANLEAAPFPPHLVVPFGARNLIGANTWGAELAVDWCAAESWRLRAGYTYLRIDIDPEVGSKDPTAFQPEGDSPDRQLILSSMLDLSKEVELGCAPAVRRRPPP